MSKERAVRRAVRDAEREKRVAERARVEAAAARRSQFWGRLTRWVPRPTVWARSSGPLAAKRRRRLGLLTFGFFVVQLLTWIVTPSWGVRVAVLLVSLFALPVAAVLAS
ncbi:MAG: hypothetical protein ABJA81_11690 [Nocardioidaceae bacterium]